MVTPTYRVFYDPNAQIIDFGQTRPDPRYLRRNIVHMEQMASYSGMAVHIHDLERGHEPPGSPRPQWCGPCPGGSVHSELIMFPPSLCYNVLTEHPVLGHPQLEESIGDLRESQATGRRFLNNYLSISLKCDADPWLLTESQWKIRADNFAALARVAVEGKLKGLFLDPEPGYTVWNWSQLAGHPDYAQRAFEEVRSIAFARGKDAIQRINSVFPGCAIWMTYGYGDMLRAGEAVNAPADSAGSNLRGTHGLWCVFLDGMLSGSDSNTIFIDGCEGNNYKPDAYAKLIRYVIQEAVPYTTIPEA